MKTIIKYILIGLGVVCVPLAFSAANEQQSTGASYRLPDFEVTGMKILPVPVKQPIPQVNGDLVGTAIKMRFTVGKKGIISHVRSAKPLIAISDNRARDFAVLMTQSLRGWKFAPALDNNGLPVRVKLIMPVEVVEKRGTQVVLASLILDTSNDYAQ